MLTSPERPTTSRSLATRTFVRRLRLEDCLRPTDAHRLLSRRARGAALLESTQPEAPGGGRSLLAFEPLCRLTLRDGTFSLEALVERGELVVRACELREVPAPRRGGTDRERILAPNALDTVRRLIASVADDGARSAFPVALVGAFGFDLVDHFDVLPPRARESRSADLDLVLALDAVVYDHRRATVEVVTRAFGGSTEERAARERLDRVCELLRGDSHSSATPTSTAPPPLRLLHTERFLQGVETALEHVRRGDVFQAVLSHRHVLSCRARAIDVYAELLSANRSPYHFCLDTADGELLGASPEPAIVVREREVLISPIAGTCARGRSRDGSIDVERDARLALALTHDPKERAEHAMLVDLARNDLARIAVPGTRVLDGPPRIERYSHVQHLVSRVRARLHPELDSLHAYAACANMGTLTGAPKLEATAILREHEPVSRGYYGGAVGILSANGDLTTAICIRSMLLRDGNAELHAGAGIVADSVPECELEEVRRKLAAPHAALCAAEAREVAR